MSGFCKYCGKVINDIECDCVKYGEQVRRYCEDCGAEVIEGIVFCLNCGKHFDEVTVSIATENEENEENEDLFCLREEFLTQEKEDDSGFEKKEEKKLPSKGLLGLFEKTYGNKEVSPEEKPQRPAPLEKAEDKRKEKPQKPTFVKPKVEILSSPLFDEENEKIDFSKDITKENSLSSFDTLNNSLIYEINEPDSEKEIVNPIIQKKNDREVREKEGVTFVPSDVLLGSFALHVQTENMLLITKYKPVVPKAITIGL